MINREETICNRCEERIPLAIDTFAPQSWLKREESQLILQMGKI